MDNLPYSLPLLWEKTNNGLQIFQDIFVSQLGTKKGLKGFSVRPEDKTGSCHITKSKKTGLYLFTDFGASDKGVNAIDYIIKTENTDFNGACKKLFNQYGLAVNEFQKNEPVTKFSTKIKEENGFWKVDYFAKIQNETLLKKIIPFYTDILLQEYHFKQVKSYENVGIGKNGNLYHRTITATADFPIYAYDKTEFAKIYQPLAPKNDKFLQKHGFVGVKQERIIYGWDRLLELVDIPLIDRQLGYVKYAETPKIKKQCIEELKEMQLPLVVIATGGSDGLNLASLGYNVIWFNSETEIINEYELTILQKIAQLVVYVPDLDVTGVKQAVAMGMLSKKHFKIKMLWLPDELKAQGKKDFSDWIRLQNFKTLENVKYQFREMLTQALEFEFWERSDRGTFNINIKKALHFLRCKGFYLHRFKTNSADATKKVEETTFVYLKDNVVTPVFNSEIKAFVAGWLEENFIDIEVQNMILKNSFFNENNSLHSLPIIDLNTKSSTKDSQLIFYKNKVVSVTSKGIEELDYKTVPSMVWQNNIINRNFAKKEKAVTITKQIIKDQPVFDIDVHHTNSNYFKLLINTSRMHWQKDAGENESDTNPFSITSKKLDEEENAQQKMELINKMFCVGRMLHKYKIKSKSYLILGIDRSIGKSSKDNKGGSGKSAIVEMMYHYLTNRKVVNGRFLHRPDESKFMLTGVTAETDLLYFEDLTAYYDVNSMFNLVTGDVDANHKGGKIVPIRYEDFANVVVTMNAVPYDLNDSFQRRIAVFECCDYYHVKNEDFKKSRSIADSFNGKQLFDENYSQEDWQNDDNFLMECLQFYLSQETKIEVNHQNLKIRNLIQKIGDREHKFLTDLFQNIESDTTEENKIEGFSHEDSKGIVWINKVKLYELYSAEIGQKKKSNQDFKDVLVWYYQTKDLVLEFKKKKVDGLYSSAEHYTIKKDQSPVIENGTAPEAEAEPAKETARPDDLPF